MNMKALTRQTVVVVPVQN